MQVVVIGAGLGGLAAAAYLRRDGHDVVVVEREPIPGGRAGLVEAAGFRLDNGPTVLTMPNLLEEAFNAAGADMASYVTIKKVDPMYRAVYADGSELTLEGYHAEDAGAQISLPSEGGDHTVVSGSIGATLPASAGDSAQLHYAHGHGDTLMQMVQQQPGLSETLSHHAAAGQHEIMAWVPVGQGLSVAQIGGLALVGAGAYALTRDTTPPVFTSATTVEPEATALPAGFQSSIPTLPELAPVRFSMKAAPPVA